MHTVNIMPPQYIGFAEDMMLILFLVCILATLVTVHRATCYRQFQVQLIIYHLLLIIYYKYYQSTSHSNCAIRRLDVTHLCVTSSQLPRTDLRPILTPGLANRKPISYQLLMTHFNLEGSACLCFEFE